MKCEQTMQFIFVSGRVGFYQRAARKLVEERIIPRRDPYRGEIYQHAVNTQGFFFRVQNGGGEPPLILIRCSSAKLAIG